MNTKELKELEKRKKMWKQVREDYAEYKRLESEYYRDYPKK